MGKVVTEKFKNMIEAFGCDFTLARDYPDSHSLSGINMNNTKVQQDIELLEELSWLLRNGKADIVLKEGE